ncbi:Lsr2 family protein (plasmid) [Nocardia sp. NBC_01377]|uniref:histone-like nucleoid-structuring protein Lsr2 n=1 Tax=Nocardia sp. NBC_01377 TaxID=2903595 RepID=UPI002F918E23
MARKVVVTLIDDYDGTSPATETVSFALDGVAYDIDLSGSNADSLRALMEPWASAGRRTGRSGRSRKLATPSTSQRGNYADVRSWARENGHQVSARGRISADVVAAYERALA